MAETFLHGVEVAEIDAGPRPIRTVRSSIIGVVGTAPGADVDAFPLNTPVLIAGSRAEAAKLDATVDGTGGGTLKAALDGIMDQIGAVVIVVRVDEGADDTETMANVIGGVNSTTGEFEGVQALLGAESVVGFAPRILCAPGFTHQRPEDPVNAGTYLANPVVSELIGIAERLRAVIIADGPNTVDADAIAYSGDFGSPRVFVVDPWVKVLDANGDIVTEPASARVAGMLAKTDNDKGFWWSPSNQNIIGIIGAGRPVDFKLGDANSRANLLNEQNVATIIRQDGYRLWGNRTLSSDPKWAFLSVRRTADIINESLQRAHLWAVDRNITKTYVEDVVEGVNAYLRTLKSLGAILGGECWADPDLNTPANITQGKVYFNFDFTPPYPAEHITFRSHLVNDYIEEVFS
ncbi:phage tail sheath subtilisin-like domain-containing protein [Marinobacterium sp. AK62]|uniref:Phage tail sheath subtilisin-like domain-containing protein n=1 Tax=Marinobacterium alkalitolerans TaxID=1542925 RepID=A0ABS3Z7G7_9GAMM|nr:phage tail sheath C-terminal domain-containing protein [Marinobacterium alkalitolerans]MBP0047645.1 phage tail sheath subtilisin-like domain-containing protein [Marinobacterium alkalitolerans]